MNYTGIKYRYFVISSADKREQRGHGLCTSFLSHPTKPCHLDATVTAAKCAGFFVLWLRKNSKHTAKSMCLYFTQ